MTAAVVFLSGCDAGDVKGDIQKYVGNYKEVLDKMGESDNASEDRNPVFDAEKEVQTEGQVSGQVDDFLRGPLKNIFTDVKLIMSADSGSTPFITKYAPKRKIKTEDGEALYQLLLSSGSRPKNDTKPTHYDSRNTVEFSVYHDLGARSYIVEIVFDLNDQVIWANVF